MHKNFSRVLTQLKHCRVSPKLQVFIPLYRGMKDTLENCQHIKRAVVEDWSITNGLLL